MQDKWPVYHAATQQVTSSTTLKGLLSIYIWPKKFQEWETNNLLHVSAQGTVEKISHFRFSLTHMQEQRFCSFTIFAFPKA